MAREFVRFPEIEMISNNRTRQLLSFAADLIDTLTKVNINTYRDTPLQQEYLILQANQIMNEWVGLIYGLQGSELYDTQFRHCANTENAEDCVYSSIESGIRTQFAEANEFVKLYEASDVLKLEEVLAYKIIYPAPWMMGYYQILGWYDFVSYAMFDLGIPQLMFTSFVKKEFDDGYIERIRTYFDGSPIGPRELVDKINRAFDTVCVNLAIRWRKFLEGEYDPIDYDLGRFEDIKNEVWYAIGQMSDRDLTPYTVQRFYGMGRDTTFEEPEDVIEDRKETDAKLSDVVVNPYLRGDALYMVDLPFTCEQVQSRLDYLDTINPLINVYPSYSPAGVGDINLDSIKDRQDFEDVYRMLYTYKKAYCDNTKQGSVVYEQKVNIVDKQESSEMVGIVASEELRDYVAIVWEQAEHGDFLPEGIPGGRDLTALAGERNLGGEIEYQRQIKYANIISSLNSYAEYPWNGPTLENNSGIRIPYDGFEEGIDLWKLWIVREVRKAFTDMYYFVQTGEETTSGYTPSIETLSTMLWDLRTDIYDNYLLAYGDELWGSVKDANWDEFEKLVLNYQGRPFDSYNDFYYNNVLPELDRVKDRTLDELLKFTLRETAGPEGSEFFLLTQVSRLPKPGDRITSKSGGTATVAEFTNLGDIGTSGYTQGYLYLTNVRGKFGQEGVYIDGEQIGGVFNGFPLEAIKYEDQLKANKLSSMTQVEIRKIVQKLKLMQTLVPTDAESRARFEAIFNAYWSAMFNLSPTDWDSMSDQEMTDWISLQTAALVNKFGDLIAVANVVSTAWSAMGVTALQEGINELYAIREEGLWRSLPHTERGRIILNIIDAAELRVSSWADMAEPDMVSTISGYTKHLKACIADDLVVDKAIWENANRAVTLAGSVSTIKSTAVGDAIIELKDMLEDHVNQFRLDAPRMPIEDDADAEAQAEQDNNIANNQTGVVSAALFTPFVKFDGMKPGKEFHVEDFTVESLTPVLKEYVQERVERGISVEPKLHGFRATLQCQRGYPMIFMEGIDRNMSDVYPEIARELSSGPDVTLEAEILHSISGILSPRIHDGKFTRDEIDGAKAVAIAFDCLFLDRQSMHNEPYVNRRNALNRYFAGQPVEYISKMPNRWCNSEDEVISAIQNFERTAGSEGAVLKTRDHIYKLSKKTDEWAKVKAKISMFVTVLKKDKTKTGAFMYTCGVVYNQKVNSRKSDIVTIKGRQYISVGATFATSIDVGVGDRLQVSVTELLEHKEGKKVYFRWEDPTVIKPVPRDPDSLGRAIQVGQILQASISQPYRTVTELKALARNATTQTDLQNIQEQLWTILSDLNNDRLRELTQNAIEYVMDRLGQAPTSELGDINYGYSVNFATNIQLDDLTKLFEGLKAEIQTDPEQLNSKLVNLARACAIRATKTGDPVLKNNFLELQRYVNIEIAKTGGLTGFDPENLREEFHRTTVLAGNLEREWDAESDPSVKDDIKRRAIELRVQFTNFQRQVYRYNLDFTDEIVYIHEILDRIIGKEEETISWAVAAQRLELLEESINYADADLKKLENAALASRSGNMELLQQIAQGAFDFTVERTEYRPPASITDIVITDPGFEGTDVGTTFGADPVTPMPTLPQPETQTTVILPALTEPLSAEQFRGLFQTVENRFTPERVKNSILELHGQLTEQQRIGYSSWIGALQDMVELQIERWQSLWERSNWKLGGAIWGRITASLESSISKALASEAISRMRIPFAVDSGTQEIINYYVANEGGMLPFQAVEGYPKETNIMDARNEVLADRLENNIVALEMIALEFIEGGGDPTSFVDLREYPKWKSFVSDIAAEVDSGIEAKIKAYGMWEDFDNPYPLASEGVISRDAVWIDQRKAIQYNLFGDEGELIQKYVDDGANVLAEQLGDGTWRIISVVTSGGDVTGDQDALINGVYSSINSTLKIDPALSGSIDSDTFSAAEFANSERQIKAALKGFVNISGTGGCGGFYLGASETDGMPIFVTAAHCLKDVDADTVTLEALTGEKVVGKIIWRGKYSVSVQPDETEYADLAIVKVDSPDEAAKCSAMGALSLAPSAASAGIAVSANMGEADLVVRDGNETSFIFDIYGSRDRGRPGYSGSPVIDSLGRVIGIWVQSYPEHYGSISESRRGYLVTIDAIKDAFRIAGVEWPESYMNVLPLEKQGVIAASATPPLFDDGARLHILQGKLLSYDGEDMSHRLSFDNDGAETGITLYIEGTDDETKLLEYRDDARLPVLLKEKPDGEPRQLDTVRMLLSRVRDQEDGNKYYEFYLSFGGNDKLNGLWAISEEAAKEYGMEAFMFKMKDETPFWMRKDNKHAQERATLSDIEKPTIETITSFIGRKPILMEE